jgi:hypothetical protein
MECISCARTSVENTNPRYIKVSAFFYGGQAGAVRLCVGEGNIDRLLLILNQLTVRPPHDRVLFYPMYCIIAQ